MGSFLAAIAVAALLSAALGGAYNLSEKTWNGGWSIGTLENNVDLVAETVLSGWGGGVRDNHSTDNFSTDNYPTDNVSNPGFWDTHSLDAVPVVREDASVEDLPTAEEFENILKQSEIAKKYTGAGWQIFAETLEVAVSFLENKGIEYHIDSENGLIVDTPGISYGTPERGRAGMDYEYAFAEWYIAGSVPSLDFLRVLENHNIRGGIAGIFYGSNDGSYPRGRVIVPVKKGLAYVYIRSKDTWPYSRVRVNVGPGENYASLGKVDNIHLHWRLGEGDYVKWNYVLENGEPTIVWPENGQPVDWKL